MNVIIYSSTNEDNISSQIGKPEYSYYFVSRDFLPLLERIANVVRVFDPETEVDPIFDTSQEAGEPCVFLSFTAPHNTCITNRCPTLPVFAWEYGSIPYEYWEENSRHDWRASLMQFGQAITHSVFTVDTVHRALGHDYPVVSIPSPVWDKLDQLRTVSTQREAVKKFSIQFEGVLIDSRNMDLFITVPRPKSPEELEKLELQREQELQQQEEVKRTLRYKVGATKRHLLEWYTETIEDLLPSLVGNFFLRVGFFFDGIVKAVIGKKRYNSHAIKQEDGNCGSTDHCEVKVKDVLRTEHHSIFVEGVVYTAVFNPNDDRKCWESMLTAFCAAFRDHSDATLLIKASHVDINDFSELFVEYLRRLSPFNCRIVVMQAYLDEAEYQKLFTGTSYYVNTSTGEGQCLPLMEYLSFGVPVIAPATTALADYIDNDFAYILDTHVEATAWQHDPRKCYRTLHYRIDWLSLVDAYKRSYQDIFDAPKLYSKQSQYAIMKLQKHCSLEYLEPQLEDFLTAAANRPGPVQELNLS